MTKVLLFFIALLSVESFSQSQFADPQNSTLERIKSPQVHLLKQFADYPVDLSSGLVDVSLPLYDINFGNIKIPLNLKFHASGLKANIKENGVLGLKWVMNIGGFISREVRGYADERNNHKQGIGGEWYIPDWMTLYGGSNDNGYFNNNIIFQTQDLSQMGMPGVYGKYEDTEYDIFTFSLPNGKSGKFILKDVNGTKTAVFMPYQPYKINVTTEYLYGSHLYITSLELTDDSGYTYLFGKQNSNDSYKYYEVDQEQYAINCWVLNSITAPNKKDIIKFEYTKTSLNGNSPLSPVVINDELTTAMDYFSDDFGYCHNSVLYNSIGWDLHRNYFVTNYNMPPYGNQEACILSKITYNDLAVNFNYLTTPRDINGFLLNNIEIKNNTEVLKKITFDMIGPGSETSYLNSFEIKDKNDQIIEKYKFDYYNLNKLPNSTKLANSGDYWGYYNSNVENLILKDTLRIAFCDPVLGCLAGPAQRSFSREIGANNNRFSNPEDMKIGMLKTITYPTGGKTEFEYEGNKVMSLYNVNGNPIKDCGGLRIKTVTEKDKNGTEIKKKEYTYGLNEDGIGQIPSYLYPDRYIKNEMEETATEWHIIDQVLLTNSDEPPYFRNESADVTYKTRVFNGYFPSRYYTFLNKLVYYNKVTEYIGDRSNNIGKIENYYSNNVPQIQDYNFDIRNYSHKRNKFAVDPSNFWNRNNLSQKIEYKKVNNNYVKARTTDYTYDENIVDEIYDVSIFAYKRFNGFLATNEGNKSKSETGIIAKEELQRIKDNPGSYFGYKVQKYTIGAENLISVREELFFDDGTSIVQTNNSEYDVNKPSFIKQSSSLNSKGENLAQKFLYPFNINTGIYSQMVNANVLSPLVEKTSLKNNKVINSSVLTYKKSDENFVPDQNYITELNTPILPSQFSAFNGATKDPHYGPNPEITYDLYDDKGNPTQITPKGKPSVCYIWGYDKKYLIATIENASFLSGQNNSITATQQTLINNAVSASFGEINATTESNLIQKLKLLRAGFPDAMVTTYTYDSLIGITSMTDPKEFTTYYEYDTYGRLKQVKDNDKKILSANKYHFTN
ncbi:hypothetical protein [Flavobacterium anhuiense]|uniref:hypothetical protein n=1 Tax=Flavobacterium anhuiense TaxID=459526 RepID=UPI000E6C1586|nr:hypothetical protein [Flavobacterium anhuiense]